MIKSLNSEFYKIFKDRLFVMGNAFLIIIAVIAMFSSYVSNDVNPMLTGANILFSRIGDNIPLFIMMVFIVHYVTIEYSTGRIKNIIINTGKRYYFYYGKYIICSIGVIIMNAISSLTYIVLSSILYGFNPNGDFNLKSFLLLILCQWIVLCGYTAIFLCVTFLIPSTIYAIICNLGIILFAPGFLSLVDNLIGTKDFLSKHWLDSYLTQLVVNDFGINILFSAILCCSIYIVATSILGVVIFKNRDI